MPHPALDILTKLGDAVSGVDPTARYKNQIGIDHVQAETDAALALAKDRRIQAEMAEQERAALERVGMTSTATFGDPGAAPIGDLIVSKRGGDYSGAMEGRNRAQQFNERAVVEQPAPIGDLAAEASRQSNLDALAPGSAVSLRRPAASGAPLIAQGEGNEPTYFNRTGTPITTPLGDALHPAARPVAPRPAPTPGPTHEQQVAEWLQGLGVEQEASVQLALKRQDPRAMFSSVLRTLTNQKDAAFRPIYTPAEAADAARSAVDVAFGAGALDRAAAPIVPPPASAAPPSGRPPLDSFFK